MLGLLAAAMSFTAAAVQAQGAESAGGKRTVAGQVLTSTAMPEIRLTFDRKFKYAGTQHFLLYGVADAEQYFFVDAATSGAVRRLYWVQFEAYVPGNTFTYDYKISQHVDIAGFDFLTDARMNNWDGPPARPDSDSARAKTFLESRGYHLSGDVRDQRLVHLIGNDRRNELLIIYEEFAGPRESGRELTKLLKRARESLTVMPSGDSLTGRRPE